MLNSMNRDGERSGAAGANYADKKLDTYEDGEALVGGVGVRLKYSGVSMKVAFTSTGEKYLLQQLSGGQK